MMSGSTSTSSTPVITLASESELAPLLEKSSNGLVTIMFTTSWHEPSQQMIPVLASLARDHPAHTFLMIDAEQFSDLTQTYPQVQSVPTFILIRNKQVVASLEGPNAPELVSLVNTHTKSTSSTSSSSSISSSSTSTSASTTPSPDEAKLELHARLKKLINACPVMIFIKGTPDAPRCGFTRQLLELLKETHVTYGYFDILSDQTVREGLKSYSNWPTYPQVYMKGELVGGLDVVKELISSGEWSSMIPSTPSVSDLTTRIKTLLSSASVLLFMKGSPNNPQCGFSRSAVALLREAGSTDFSHFDILTDQEIRQGLKEYSNWPTYPQLYIKGELIGGLDVMQELHASGELSGMLQVK